MMVLIPPGVDVGTGRAWIMVLMIFAGISAAASGFGGWPDEPLVADWTFLGLAADGVWTGDEVNVEVREGSRAKRTLRPKERKGCSVVACAFTSVLNPMGAAAVKDTASTNDERKK